MIRQHRMPHGAELLPSGDVRFQLWAPACHAIHVELAVAAGLIQIPMQRADGGWHHLTTSLACGGTRYQFVLPDGTRVADPASRFQPDDVHGPSEVIDPTAYAWKVSHWAGRPWRDAVIYELHVGAFTPEGTFRAAMERLDDLALLGVTAVEVMPVADFPGAHNWGYDGVLLYAPDSTYGRPEDFKAFIDAAHRRGLMVLLDVVYNHFGPEGNYLPVLAPGFFTERHVTPWGAAINYDGAQSGPVREFVIHNALYWLLEYDLDGLRLDAVHAIVDDSAEHLLDELARRVRALVRRPVHLIVENEENQAQRLRRETDGSPRSFTAQWNDDMHHVLHAAATGEGSGYYAEYLGDTAKLAVALAEGFAFQGQTMEFRGSPRGQPSGELPPSAFIAFIQNHDQIGNRAFGERITAIAPIGAVRAIAAVYLLLPQTPMIFMGEEWGAAQPFTFFCDFHGDLAIAVRQGRREEFAKFPEFSDEAVRARIPDPQAAATFMASKLRWDDRHKPVHAAWLEFYRRVLQVRRDALLPLLPEPGSAGVYRVIAAGAVRVIWPATSAQSLILDANLSPRRVADFGAAGERLLWLEGTVDTSGALEPWTVRWSVGVSEFDRPQVG